MMNMNDVARQVTELLEDDTNNAQTKKILRKLRAVCQGNRDAWYATSNYLRYAKADALKPRKRSGRK